MQVLCVPDCMEMSEYVFLIYVDSVGIETYEILPLQYNSKDNYIAAAYLV